MSRWKENKSKDNFHIVCVGFDECWSKWHV